MSSTLHSVVSAAPSFAQTLLSAFHPDRDDEMDPDCAVESPVVSHDGEEARVVYDIDIDDEQAPLLPEHSRLGRRRSSHSSSLYKYFRPMFKRAYYSALFHLLVLNFPFALTAWVYLFVFTLVSVNVRSGVPSPGSDLLVAVIAGRNDDSDGSSTRCCAVLP